MDTRNDLERKLPTTGNRNGLFVGPNKDLLVTGERLPTVAPDLSPKPYFFAPTAPTAGQPGIKGDHPVFLGNPRAQL